MQCYARTAHGLLRRQCLARAYATEALASSSTEPSPSPASLGSTTNDAAVSSAGFEQNPLTKDRVTTGLNPRPRRQTETSRTIFVRSWDSIRSMSELFGMVRAIERKYGRVKEFHVARDSDTSELYMSHFWATFRDQESMNRVPTQSSILQAEVPIANPDRPGGVGLDELQDVLQAEDWEGPEQQEVWKGVVPQPEGSEAAEKTTRTVELRVEPTDFTEPRRNTKNYQNYRSPDFFGHGFYLWGGFYTPSPEEPARPSEWMKKARVKWTDVVTAREKQAAAARAARAAVVAAEEAKERKNAEAQVEPVTKEVSEKVEEQDLSASVSEAPPAASLGTTASASDLTIASTTLEKEASSQAASDTDETVATADETAATPRMTRRERLLAQARANARTPLPPSAVDKAAEEKRAEKEMKEEQEPSLPAQTSSSCRKLSSSELKMLLKNRIMSYSQKWRGDVY
ncbi:hypothetical protein A0H81_14922 [Grifola frondosa]|uniref:Uncharacterized protein n=1 Tax=Grifola frondosa TaxID=5627 RepID=A0A1C7LKK2_GRIFR|nr:hypothetical protein A0H81_14922 [Grifola frondosa]